MAGYMDRPVGLAVLVAVVALAACTGGGQPRGGTDAEGTTGASQSTAATTRATAAATTSTEVDLSTLDACTLLDEQTIRELTGTELEFITDQIEPEPTESCFWGATTPVPPYVEIQVFLSDGLSDYTGNGQWECTIAPVTGVGTEAAGGDCIAPGEQRRVYLQARERGVAVRLLVNEPSRPLEPDDLAGTVATLLEEIGN